LDAAAQELPPGLQRLKDYQIQLSLRVTYFLAFFAGLISITSPCGFALLPAYFSVAFKDRKKSISITAAFSIGLLIALVIFGFIAGILGDFFNSYKINFAVISGYMIILFGMMLVLNVNFALLNNKDERINARTLFSARLNGLFFGDRRNQ
jgi:cytochrome c-type biogenesis protein